MPLKGQVPPEVERKGWALHTVSHVRTDREENSTFCPHWGVSRKHGKTVFRVLWEEVNICDTFREWKENIVQLLSHV